MQRQKIQFLFAHSQEEAETILKCNPNIYIAVLDVVREHRQSGFELIELSSSKRMRGNLPAPGRGVVRQPFNLAQGALRKALPDRWLRAFFPVTREEEENQ